LLKISKVLSREAEELNGRADQFLEAVRSM
jgi:hypothetical protein